MTDVPSRLAELKAKYDQGCLTEAESLEWAELSVEAMYAAREARKVEAHNLAAAYFEHLRAQYGEETARAAWKAAPPRRRVGYRVTDDKDWEDRQIVMLHQTNREMGMTNDKSAELLKASVGHGGSDLREVLKSLDRTKARLRKRKLIPE